MRPRDKETDEIASRLGVTKGQARRLRKKGVSGDNLSVLEQAKLEKILIETAKLEEQLAILKREHVSVGKVREDALRAGSVLKAELTALSGSLPPLLSGLTEPEMQPVIEEIVHKTLSDFVYAVERII